MIRAIGFDLDDTLYDHAQYVRGAHRDIADAVARRAGISAAEFFDRIFTDWQQRTSRCDRIFRDALTAYGIYSPELERELVGVYRAHEPTLTPHAGVPSGLAALQTAGFRLGLLTDGQLAVQQRKLRALGLESAFTARVYTGALGREYYKPHEAGFARLASDLNVSPAEVAYVGDNPFNDFETPHRMGMTTIRVFTGEYRQLEPDLASVRRGFPDVAQAMDWLLANHRRL